MGCAFRTLTTAVAVVVLSLAASPRASGSDSTPPTVVGGVSTYVVRQGDTLRSVGARAGIDAAALAEENGVDGDARLLPGQLLRVDNRHIVPDSVLPGVLVVNVPQRMLFYVGDDGGLLEAAPVAVGRRGWATPTGSFTVLAKETQPTWDVPESIRLEALREGRWLPVKVAPGPDNPLGAFWIGLSIGGIGVHGTNAPGSIYRAATHGCIRVHPEDIAKLFGRVSVGTAGRIIYEPVLLAQAGEAVFLEVHRDVYGRLTAGTGERARALAAAAGLTGWIDWTIAFAVIEARHGIARDVTTHALAP